MRHGIGTQRSVMNLLTSLFEKCTFLAFKNIYFLLRFLVWRFVCLLNVSETVLWKKLVFLSTFLIKWEVKRSIQQSRKLKVVCDWFRENMINWPFKKKKRLFCVCWDAHLVWYQNCLFILEILEGLLLSFDLNSLDLKLGYKTQKLCKSLSKMSHELVASM